MLASKILTLFSWRVAQLFPFAVAPELTASKEN
jgi:hypothetical protein